jgi:L-aminopeptidase/D-esterase-like protein
VLSDVPGVRVGHWTDAAARTGCTVVLLPEGTVASGEVRGGAPATREFALLDPSSLVSRIDAVVLAGGSAFGLAAGDGVMRWLEERGRGFATPAGPVPIVVGMCLFDLVVGDPAVRPGADQGYAACEAATAPASGRGGIGAGAGATVGKWRGAEHRRDAGLGSATSRHGPLLVAALLAVNAWGDVDAAGAASDDADLPLDHAFGAGFDSTTIGVVVTNARLDKGQCLLVAQGAHDGLARSLVPAHTRRDGDAVVAAATGAIEAPVDLVRLLAVQAVARAVRSSVAPPPVPGGREGDAGSPQ